MADVLADASATMADALAEASWATLYATEPVTLASAVIKEIGVVKSETSCVLVISSVSSFSKNATSD